MSWFDEYVNQSTRRYVIEIRNIINKAQHIENNCSKLVEKTYDEKCAHATHLTYVTEFIDINKNTFIAWEGNNNTDIRSLLVLAQTP